ncbi:hypothetical protein Kpol_505p23 [Vanderwaltozyma polyspora DSM 70294]|uniref:MIP18 family-like domain-containing protein n=1 Tax=Vanderwaltozyma polyspora (strain ATCC 22028 / DSM 70294 / BCRC 21397 / CBS 2163 / NBRC 10782 / NRRL Y-8283 / UCD 57-17) TaxID=436907 RepID=A7TNB4_VANPO|nr:uncharacterized protein Kpol_505p23 [Vanderwaltozyma polyspora DSM 70294]EDO16246.1 hypothetical protein Kpol_505p23 [Vanderwaltozyma polyspora DSM 70294]
MSEYINENPEVLDDTQLPTRKDEDNELLFNTTGSNSYLDRKKMLLRMDNSSQSQVLQNIDLLDKLFALHHHDTPDLTEDDESIESFDDEDFDQIDAQEIYDLIAHISDPEHPLTLGQLAIVNIDDIEVIDNGNRDEISEVIVRITPTITHCSLATLIGLGIRVRLERALPPRFRINIILKKGTHQSENQVNKQLNDKERVAAACENDQLLGVVSTMLGTCK